MALKTIILFGFLSLILNAQGRKWKTDHLVQMDPATNPSLKLQPQHIKASIGEWMDITCPQYDPDTPEEKQVLFLLYDLDSVAYRNCDFRGKTEILNCSSPYTETKLTIKFQRSSPNPFGFTFKEGKTYYYVAIPVGETDCTNAMTIVLSVKKRESSDSNKEEPVIPDLQTVKSTTPTTTITTTTSTTTTKTTTFSARLTSTKKAVASPKSSERKEDGPGGGASTVQCATLMTSLIVLLMLWIHW